MALTGASAGFMVKYYSSSLFYESALSKPWKYPKYMLIGAVLFSFYDYQRRVWLETLLKAEEKTVRTRRYQQLENIALGEELLGENRVRLDTFMASHHQI